MIVLVGCEESQEVCIAFRAMGHEAYSCDKKDCSGGHPEWHLQMDVYKALDKIKPDLFICHPDCTKVAVSGNAHYSKGKLKYNERLEAAKWTEKLWLYAISICKKVVFENPVGCLNSLTKMPKPQYIQPHEYGHPESKKTGLFYFNVQPLKPTKILPLPQCGHWDNQTKDHQNKLLIDGKQVSWDDPRTKEYRSKTYPGIARAMAEQFGQAEVKKYPGQKKIYGVYHKIINEIPFFKKCYELFAGSAQISQLLFDTADTVTFILNDLDRSVTDKYNFTGRKNIIVKNELANYILVTELSSGNTDTFIFMDPPYLHSTRPNNTALYKYEMTEADHIQLLKSVLQSKCNCMIIHPKCELYDTMLKDWRKVLIKIRYHNKTSIECLYMNYSKPDQLYTDKYLGTDCWDRQRIKRKSDRLIKKIEALPVQERKYILTRLK